MKLEDQVCSFELAKRLKELGVPQESLFYYCLPEGGKTDKDRFISFSGSNDFCQQDTCYFNHDYISAFTVAELGKKIRPALKKHPNISLPTYGTFDDDEIWFFKYALHHAKALFVETEADARAKLLIYLIEHGLIEI